MAKKKTQKKKSGRKWFDGKDEKEVIAKCEEVWAMDGTDAEAAYYADISVYSLCRYLKEFPEVAERKDKLRNKPVLLARQTVMKRMSESYNNAMDYLSRKRKDEFSPRKEITGADGGSVFYVNEEKKKKAASLIDKFLNK